ncbi:uncharacterized protein LOC121373403 [Gigantopelta aegis]|uniref:uncharacterized protein LOC121373403 n=1 Tax=Gigantopelta aegis TaxID=1735272 RepID=UPI001B88C80F|nr:uncharacterized protein LOC121373403 [Gigantopelta aegis]
MKVTTFDIFFQALMLILDIDVIHSLTVSMRQRVVTYTATLECIYTKEYFEQFGSLVWSRKQNNGTYAILAYAWIKNGEYRAKLAEGGEYLKERTAVRFIPGVFSFTYTDVRCVDEATYTCRVEYRVNSMGRLASEEMFYQVQGVSKPESPSPPPTSSSSPNLYLIVGLVVAGIDTVDLIVAVIICIRSRSKSKSTTSKVEHPKVENAKKKDHEDYKEKDHKGEDYKGKDHKAHKDRV